jgi:hypothetical protein
MKTIENPIIMNSNVMKKLESDLDALVNEEEF